MVFVKVVAAFLVAVCAAALAVDEFSQWKMDSGWKAACVVIPIVIGFIGASAGAISERRNAIIKKRARQVEAILGAVAFQIQDMTSREVDVRDLGTAAYVKSSFGVRVPPWQTRLLRIARVRSRDPGVSGVKWRPGVGVVGLCVSQGQDVCVDLSDFDSQFMDSSKEEWDGLSSGDRMGLRFFEYRNVRGKFGAVLATPIIEHGGSRILGCVSIDGPSSAYDEFSKVEVRQALSAAADTIALHVFS